MRCFALLMIGLCSTVGYSQTHQQKMAEVRQIQAQNRAMLSRIVRTTASRPLIRPNQVNQVTAQPKLVAPVEITPQELAVLSDVPQPAQTPTESALMFVLYLTNEQGETKVGVFRAKSTLAFDLPFIQGLDWKVEIR